MLRVNPEKDPRSTSISLLGYEFEREVRLEHWRLWS